jgi:hypothetical protein
LRRANGQTGRAAVRWRFGKTVAAALLTVMAVTGGTVTIVESPAAAAPDIFPANTIGVDDGGIQVYFRIDTQIGHGYVEQIWGNLDHWVNLGSPPGVELIGTPSAVRTPDGRLTVFAVGAVNRNVWHKWQLCDGCLWSDWYSLGGGLASNPAAVYRQSLGIFVVFAVAHDRDLWHTWQLCSGCGWSAWTSLSGGPFISPPIVWLQSASRNPAVVQLNHQDGSTRRRTQSNDADGHWGNWVSI